MFTIRKTRYNLKNLANLACMANENTGSRYPGLSATVSKIRMILIVLTVGVIEIGCFPLCQRFRRFRLEFKWKGPFRFLLTSGGGPHISVGIFRPKFTVPFLTYGFFALIRKFGKRIQNDESHFYWLARFNRKMSFHFPQVFPLTSDRSVWA